MDTNERTRQIVREKYAAIATGGRLPVSASCCDAPAPASCCGGRTATASFAESEYSQMEGYARDADLSLGCGVPTAFASLQPGQTVVDLGSGAGNDVFIAARAVGPTGRVFGVDMTPEMIARARANAEKLGAANVEFRLGEIEALPLESAVADVVISNCVLNLVPDKQKAFAEIYRVLKPGGRFTVSDIVTDSELPEPVRRSADLWAGCVSGAIRKQEYLEIAERAGFELEIEKERAIEIPADVIASAMGDSADRPEDVRILSITLTGRKRAR
jgi:SAM-dependent methyltransferase